MQTVLTEYTRMDSQNKNLVLENKALMERQNSMKSIAEQSRILMEAIGLPAIEGNTTPPFESLPLSSSAPVPAKKSTARRKSDIPKAIKNLMANPSTHSLTQKCPKVPVKNNPNSDESAKRAKKRPRPDSPQNQPETSSSSYWSIGNILAPGSSKSPPNEQKLKTNAAFEQKKQFGKWSDH